MPDFENELQLVGVNYQNALQVPASLNNVTDDILQTVTIEDDWLERFKTLLSHYKNDTDWQTQLTRHLQTDIGNIHINNFKVLYARMKGKLDGVLPPIDYANANAIATSLSMGLGACTEGVIERAQSQLAAMQLPKNSDDLLCIARTDLVRRYASLYVKNNPMPLHQVHDFHRILEFAQAIGLAIHNPTSEVQYTTLNPENTQNFIKNQLIALTNQRYQYYRWVDLIINHWIDYNLMRIGYKGHTKDGYDTLELDRLKQSTAQLLPGYQSELTDYDFIVSEYDPDSIQAIFSEQQLEHISHYSRAYLEPIATDSQKGELDDLDDLGMYVILDLNWDYIKQRLWRQIRHDYLQAITPNYHQIAEDPHELAKASYYFIALVKYDPEQLAEFTRHFEDCYNNHCFHKVILSALTEIISHDIEQLEHFCQLLKDRLNITDVATIVKTAMRYTYADQFAIDAISLILKAYYHQLGQAELDEWLSHDNCSNLKQLFSHNPEQTHQFLRQFLPNSAICDYLLALKPFFDEQQESIWHMVVNHYSPPTLETLLQHRPHADLPPIDEVDSNGLTILHITAKNQAISAFKAIITSIDEPLSLLSKTDHHGIAVQHIAAYIGNTDLLDQILRYPISINAQDESGHTALHYATLKNRSKAIETILTSSVAHNINTTSKYSAINFAIKYNYTGALTVLLSLTSNIGDHIARHNILHHAIHNNKSYAVIRELVNHTSNVNAENSSRRRPLDCAIKRNNPEVVKLLIEAGADYKYIHSNGYSPLAWAIDKMRVSAAFAIINSLSTPEQLSNQLQLFESTPASSNIKEALLFLAVEWGEVSFFKMINQSNDLINSFNWRCLNPNGHSIAHSLAKCQHDAVYDITQQLIYIDSKSNNSESLFNFATLTKRDLPIHRAAANVKQGMAFIKALEDNNIPVDFETSNYNGKTPIHIAAQFGLVDLFNHIELSSEIVHLSNDKLRGHTPFHFACAAGQSEILHILLPYVNNINTLDIDGYSPLNLAAQNGHSDIIEMLFNLEEYDNESNIHDQRNALFFACTNGHYQAVKTLLQYIPKSSYYDTPEDDGATALHAAVIPPFDDMVTESLLKNKFAIIRLLIEAGLDINQPNAPGYTPLLSAIWSGQERIAEFLIQEISEIQLDNVLEHALKQQCWHIADQLIQKGYQLDNMNDLLFSLFANTPHTPLEYFTEKNFFALYKSLLEQSTPQQINQVTLLNEETAIVKAARLNNAIIFNLLIHNEADPTLSDSAGFSALSYLIRHNNQALIATTLENLPDDKLDSCLNYMDINGDSPITLAIRYDYPTFFDELQNAGKLEQLRDLSCCLSADTDITMPPLLSWLIWHDRYHIIQSIITNTPADQINSLRNQVDWQNKTPYDVAQSHSQSMVDLLTNPTNNYFYTNSRDTFWSPTPETITTPTVDDNDNDNLGPWQPPQHFR